MNATEDTDFPLVRFSLERLVPDPSGENPTATRPVIAVGDWISMPYLVGGHERAHERYHADRLLTLKRLEPDGRVIIDVAGMEQVMVFGTPIIVGHDGEEVRVEISCFTSRSALRDRTSP